MKAPRENKSSKVDIRMTPAQRRKLEAVAAALGVKNSEAARRLLLPALDKSRAVEIPAEPKPETPATPAAPTLASIMAGAMTALI